MKRAMFVLVCLGLAGCSSQSYEGERRYPLSGKVTYEGEVVDLGTISFLPESGGGQRPAGGLIENGMYSVPEEEGANAGKHRVEIHWAKKTGKQHHDSELNMMVDDRKEALPPRFHEKTELSADVGDGKTTFDFDLKK